MSNKRGPYSSERQKKRRRRILQVAGVLLQKHGLDALTMQSIAEVSEVSTKTLYNLFGSRDLLLLEAASERLADLEHSPWVLEEEPGIPRLLAFAVGTMAQFEEMPKYAKAVIAIIVRADMEPETAYRNMGPVQRFTLASLEIARANGELVDDLDFEELSYVVAANLWGTVLLWEKGVLQLDQLMHQIALSNCLTLTPVCVGKRQQALSSELQRLLAGGSTKRNPHAKSRARSQRIARSTERANVTDITRGNSAS